MSYAKFRPGAGTGIFQGRTIMKKLTLNVETLNVQSFAPADAPQNVLGAEPTNTTPECCYTFGCGDSIHQAC